MKYRSDAIRSPSVSGPASGVLLQIPGPRRNTLDRLLIFEGFVYFLRSHRQISNSDAARVRYCIRDGGGSWHIGNLADRQTVIRSRAGGHVLHHVSLERRYVRDAGNFKFAEVGGGNFRAIEDHLFG